MNVALPIAVAKAAPRDRAIPTALKPVSAEEFSERLLEAAAKSRQPARDLALAHVLLGTGLTPIEIASLQIADYLQEDGTVRERAAVRGDAARNAKMRPLLWTCPAVTAAVNAYLVERSLVFGGYEHDKPYLGFDPEDRLFLTASGYRITMSHSMSRRRKRCAGLHERFLRLLRAADLADYSTFYGRKVFAARLFASGASLREIALLLGVSRQVRVKRMIDDVPVRANGIDRLAKIVAQLI